MCEELAKLRRLGILKNEADMRNLLTEFVEKMGSQRELAAHLGISYGYLGDILHGRREVSGELAARLGWQRKSLFVRD